MATANVACLTWLYATLLITFSLTNYAFSNNFDNSNQQHVYMSVDIEPPPKHGSSTSTRKTTPQQSKSNERVRVDQSMTSVQPHPKIQHHKTQHPRSSSMLQHVMPRNSPQATARFERDEFYDQLKSNKFRLTYFNPTVDGIEKPCGMLISLPRQEFFEQFTTRFRRCQLQCYEPKWVVLVCTALTSAHELGDNLNVLKAFVQQMVRIPFGMAGLNLSLSIESSNIYQLPSALLEESLDVKYAQYLRQIRFINCTLLTSPLPDLSAAKQLDVLAIQNCPNVRALHRARLPQAHKLNLIRLRLLLHDTGIKSISKQVLPPHLEALEFVCTRKCRIGRVQPKLFKQFPLLDYVYIEGVADGLYSAHLLNSTQHISVLVVRNSRLNLLDTNDENDRASGGSNWSIVDNTDNEEAGGGGEPRMRVLVLENVGFESLPPDALVGVENRLQYLSLAGNHLQRIQREPFRHLRALNYLNLANNPIRSIERGTFEHMNQLQELWLPVQGKSFYDCRDCTNDWLREWLQSSPPSHYLQPRDPSSFYCFAEAHGVKEYKPIIESEDKCTTTTNGGDIENANNRDAEEYQSQQRYAQRFVSTMAPVSDIQHDLSTERQVPSTSSTAKAAKTQQRMLMSASNTAASRSSSKNANNVNQQKPYGLYVPKPAGHAVSVGDAAHHMRQRNITLAAALGGSVTKPAKTSSSSTTKLTASTAIRPKDDMANASSVTLSTSPTISSSKSGTLPAPYPSITLVLATCLIAVTCGRAKTVQVLLAN